MNGADIKYRLSYMPDVRIMLISHCRCINLFQTKLQRPVPTGLHGKFMALITFNFELLGARF